MVSRVALCGAPETTTHHMTPQQSSETSRGAGLRVGLVGRGILRSRSPAMHMAEGAAHGLAYTYDLFDVATPAWAGQPLAEIVRSAEDGGFAGLNVTFPFKIEAVALLDDMSADAAALGAVNTIVFRDSQRIGHNTDLWGFAENFRRNMADAATDSVLLVGAGGAGAAVAHALVDCGVARLLIHDMDGARAEALAAKVVANRPAARVEASDDIASALASGVDGLVNATPVGMTQAPGMPVDPALLRPDLWVADVVYVPLETELLAAARTRGCRVLSGAGMAIHQAARAFHLFTGLVPDPERMAATFAHFDEA